MSTSLAQQLRTLQFAEQHVSAPTQRATLLFTPEVAARTEPETVRLMAASALDQLVLATPTLAAFESFVAATSRDVDRSRMTRADNAALDLQLASLLRALGPVVQAPAAHKVLEWLVWRFDVHRLNVGAVLECILPYHETKLFARVVRICDVSKHFWLDGVHKTGAPLTRQALVACASSDVPVLKLLAAMPDRYLADPHTAHAAHAPITLYFSVVAGVLSRAPVSNDTMVVLLPHLTAGLVSPHRELRLVTLALVSQLAALAQQLAPQAATTFCDLVSQNCMELAGPEALTCVALLCRQEALAAGLSAANLAALVTAGVLDGTGVAALCSTAHIAVVTPFLMAVARGLVEAAAHLAAAPAVLLDLLQRVALPDPVVATLGAALIAACPAWWLSSAPSPALPAWLGPVLAQLERRYPLAFDAFIATHLTAKTAAAPWAQSLLALCVSPLRQSWQAPVDHDESDAAAALVAPSLALGLAHPSTPIRLAAVTALKNVLADVSQELAAPDAQLLSERLLALLADSDDAVVRQTLDLGPLLVAHVEAAALFQQLTARVSSKSKTVKKALQVLAGPFLEARPAFIEQLATLLIGKLFSSSSTRSHKAAAHVLEGLAASDLARLGPLFAKLPKPAADTDADASSSSSSSSAVHNQKLVASFVAAVVAELGAPPRPGSATATILAALASPSTARVVAELVLLGAVIHATHAKQPVPVALVDALVAATQVDCALGAAPVSAATAAAVTAATAALVSAASGALTGVPPALVLAAQAHTTSLVAGDLSAVTSPALAGVVLHALTLVLPVDGDALARAAALFQAATSAPHPAHFAGALRAVLHRLVGPGPDAQMHFLGLQALLPGAPALPICRALGTLAALVAAGTAATGSKKSGKGGSKKAPWWAVSGPVGLVGTTHAAVEVRSAAVHLLERLVASAAGQAAIDAHDPVALALAAVLQVPAALVHDAEAAPRRLAGALAAHPAAVPMLADVTLGAHAPLDPDSPVLASFTAHWLSLLAHVPGGARAAVTLPLLTSLLSMATAQGWESLSAEQATLVHLILAAFTPDTAPLFKPAAATGHNAAFDQLLAALAVTPAGNPGGPGPQAWVLEHVLSSLAFVDALSAGQMSALLALLCTQLRRHGDSAPLLAAALRALPISAVTFVAELSRCLNVAPEQDGSAKAGDPAPTNKKRRVSAVGVPVATPEQQLLRVQETTTLLEVLLTKPSHTIRQHERLMAPLFELLSTCMTLDASVQPQAEHVKLLVLECLSALFAVAKDTKSLPEECVNTTLLVDCLRASDNPQLHQTALLLLSHIAVQFPSRVLDSILPVFTFMGASTVRQDDSFNFVVLQRTITTIVPVLIAAPRPAKQSAASVLGHVLSIFVDALEHIPVHRRLLVLSSLVTTLQPAASLHLAVGLVFKKMVLAKPAATGADGATATGTTATTTAAAAIAGGDYVAEGGFADFCLDLAVQFAPATQLGLLRALLRTVTAASLVLEPRGPQPSASDRAALYVILDPAALTPKQLRQYKYSLVAYVVRHLSCKAFLKAVTELEQSESSQSLNAEFHALLEAALTLASLVREQGVAARASDGDRQRGFWQQLTAKAHDVVDSVVGLMSVEDFTAVTASLLADADPVTVRKALLLLTERVQDYQISEVASSFADTPAAGKSAWLAPRWRDTDTGDEAGRHFVKLLPAVAALLVPAAAGDDAKRSVLQSAAFAITVLTTKLAKFAPQAFVSLLDPVLTLLASTSDAGDLEMCAALVVAMAALTTELGVRVVTAVPRLLPFIVTALGAITDALGGSDPGLSDGQKVLFPGLVVALQKLLRGVPQLLGPYLAAVCRCIVQPQLRQTSQYVDAATVAKIDALTASLPARVTPRLLLPALYQAFAALTSGAQPVHAGVPPLMALIAASLGQVPAKELPNLQPRAVAFLLEAMDLRARCAPSDPAVGVSEDAVIKALVALVLRLSEATFKPIFLRLVDWASVDPSAHPARFVVLFKVAAAVTESLKSLFVPYFGHLLRLAVQLLTDGPALLHGHAHLAAPVEAAVLLALQRCFASDAVGFLTKDRFTLLLQPLVDMLDSRPAEGKAVLSYVSMAAYLQRVRSEVVPVLGQFAVAANSEAQWRALNHAVLLKSRSPLASVRQASLLAVREFYQLLGDQFLPLLPETVPFVAELLEDDAPEVERECQALVALVEQFLGEGETLQGYF